MSFAKKITVIPATISNEKHANNVEYVHMDHNTNQAILKSKVNKAPNGKSKIYDKISRYIKVILKIANKGGYDEDLRIKNKDGTYLLNSNVVDLLNHAMSTSRVLYGETEFIQLLKDCDVDPEMLINENVKMKLYKEKNRAPSRDNENVSESDSDMQNDSSSTNNFILKNNNKKMKVIEDSELTDWRDDAHTPEGQDKLNESKPQSLKRKINDVEDDTIDSELWEIP